MTDTTSPSPADIEAAVQEVAGDSAEMGTLFVLMAIAKYHGAVEDSFEVVRRAMAKFKGVEVNAQTAWELVVEIVELASARFANGTLPDEQPGG